MSPIAAAKLLNLPADASPEQLEARFQELRQKLEDKIAKAPTPGLKTKYRESLDEITTAFETLTLAADSSSLPVLQRQKPEDGGRKQANLAGQRPDESAVDLAKAANPNSRVENRKSGKEFLYVALLAVVVLGAGGWWLVQTRAENAEKARIAAEAKADAERKAEAARIAAEKKKSDDEAERLRVAAAEKAEKDRLDRLFTQLRGRMAELNVAYEAQMRTEQAAERELTELKSQERELSRELKSGPTPESRRLAAQVRAQDRYVGWLRETLPAHPAKVAKVRAEELISARAPDDAPAAVDAYTAALAQLKSDIANSKGTLAVTGPLSLSSNLEGTTWRLKDAFGLERTGSAPASLEDIAFGRATVTFSRSGWPDLNRNVEVGPVRATASAEFPIGSLRLESTPAGASVFRGKELLGLTPLDLPQMPTGTIDLSVSLKGHRGQTLSGAIENGRALNLSARLVISRSEDPVYLLEIARENLALISDPTSRAQALSEIIRQAVELGLKQEPGLKPLLDAHLEACRAIPSPKDRLQALAFLPTLARIDLPASQAWAEEAEKCFAQFTAPDDRLEAFFWADSFWMHPQSFSRVTKAMDSWFGADDWAKLAALAKHQRQLGNEAEAQRLAALAGTGGEYRQEHAQERLAEGSILRQIAPLRLALMRDDLATAQRELAGFTGQLDYLHGNYSASEITVEFARLNDFSSAAKIISLTKEGSRGAVVGAAANNAANSGNRALVDQLIGLLPETSEEPLRSRAYLAVAEVYADAGLWALALAASNKVVTFLADSSTKEYFTERMKFAAALASLRQPDRARQVAATIKFSFNKEADHLLIDASTYYLSLGDRASFEQALKVLGEPDPSFDFPVLRDMMVNVALTQGVSALCRLERTDEAEQLVQRLSAESRNVATSATLRIAHARALAAGEGNGDEVLANTKPGAERLNATAALLQLQYQRGQAARFDP
jgi:hypothetical protein